MKSFFHLALAMNLLACFLSIRIAKLTNRCSPRVSRVGPSFHSCQKKKNRSCSIVQVNQSGRSIFFIFLINITETNGRIRNGPGNFYYNIQYLTSNKNLHFLLGDDAKGGEFWTDLPLTMLCSQGIPLPSP